jgi:hypothetical protein
VFIYSVVISFFVLLLKGQLYKRLYTFTSYCGGPLYGPEYRQRILQIRETSFTSRTPLLEKSQFLNEDFKILNKVDEP